MADWTDLYERPREPEFRDIAFLAPLVRPKAQELAQALGCYVRAWTPGDGPLAAFLDGKPEIVLAVPDPAVLRPLLQWAQKKSLPAIGPCLDVTLNVSTREAAGRRVIFGGAMVAEIASGGRKPQIFVMDPARLP